MESTEVTDILQSYGVGASDEAVVVAAMRRKPDKWRDFMMRFELALEAPDPRRALRSALTIAGSYVVGGLIPLSPYIIARSVPRALAASVGLTLLALLLFGYVKGRFTGAGLAIGVVLVLAPSYGGLSADRVKPGPRLPVP